jgi:proline dehydrogenase
MKLLSPLAKRFIAGHDFNSAKLVIDGLMKQGYKVSIDYVGESIRSVEEAVEAAQQYFDIIEYYKHDKIDISIKPTQIGLLIDQDLCIAFLTSIAKEADKYGHTIRLDMEDSKLTARTIDVCLEVNKDCKNVGIALQANLHRTNKDINSLIKKNISIRLVKGAYKENEDIAEQSRIAIEMSFFDYAARLKSHKANKPAIATHDEELIEDITEIIPNPKYFDYEFLYGIRRDLQKNLLHKGYSVRIYIPFGKNWLPYTVRRLREWKNLKFVIKNIVKEWVGLTKTK